VQIDNQQITLSFIALQPNFIPQPILNNIISFNNRLHLLQSQFITVPYQLFSHLFVLLNAQLYQISWTNRLSPL